MDDCCLWSCIVNTMEYPTLKVEATLERSKNVMNFDDWGIIMLWFLRIHEVRHRLLHCNLSRVNSVYSWSPFSLLQNQFCMHYLFHHLAYSQYQCGDSCLHVCDCTWECCMYSKGHKLYAVRFLVSFSF
jgi:hypothetical protein